MGALNLIEAIVAQVTRLKLAIQLHWPGTMESLAHRCALNPSHLSQWARGNKACPPHRRAMIASVLHLSPPDLEGWVEGEQAWRVMTSSS